MSHCWIEGWYLSASIKDGERLIYWRGIGSLTLLKDLETSSRRLIFLWSRSKTVTLRNLKRGRMVGRVMAFTVRHLLTVIILGVGCRFKKQSLRTNHSLRYSLLSALSNVGFLLRSQYSWFCVATVHLSSCIVE